MRDHCFKAARMMMFFNLNFSGAMSLNTVYVNTGINNCAPMFAVYFSTMVFPQQSWCLMISDF